MKLVAAS